MEHRIPLNKGEILDPCMGSVCDQVNLQKCFPKIICSVWGQSLSSLTVTYVEHQCFGHGNIYQQRSLHCHSRLKPTLWYSDMKILCISLTDHLELTTLCRTSTKWGTMSLAVSWRITDGLEKTVWVVLTLPAVYSQNFQSGRLVSVNSVAIPGMKRKEKHPNCCVLEQPEQVCEAYAESNPLPGAQLRQTCCVGWCWMRWDKEKKNAPVKMCPSTFQEQQQWWQSSPFIWCCSLTGWFAGIVRCQRKLLSQDMKAF